LPSGALPTFATNHFGNIAIGINVERTPEVIETRIGIAGPIARIEIWFINAGRRRGRWPRSALPTFATNVFGKIAISVHVKSTPIEIERCIGIAFTVACVERGGFGSASRKN
jgi:hypothetical protein